MKKIIACTVLFIFIFGLATTTYADDDQSIKEFYKFVKKIDNIGNTIKPHYKIYHHLHITHQKAIKVGALKFESRVVGESEQGRTMPLNGTALGELFAVIVNIGAKGRWNLVVMGLENVYRNYQENKGWKDIKAANKEFQDLKKEYKKLCKDLRVAKNNYYKTFIYRNYLQLADIYSKEIPTNKKLTVSDKNRLKNIARDWKWQFFYLRPLSQVK